MGKNKGIWVIAGIAGILLVLLLNTSPLSRLGLTMELPFAWQSAATGSYKDAFCKDRHSEGIPFAFKRPNENQTCTFDTNKLALLLNGVIGAGLGLSCAFVGLKRSNKNKETL